MHKHLAIILAVLATACAPILEEDKKDERAPRAEQPSTSNATTCSETLNFNGQRPYDETVALALSDSDEQTADLASVIYQILQSVDLNALFANESIAKLFNMEEVNKLLGGGDLAALLSNPAIVQIFGQLLESGLLAKTTTELEPEGTQAVDPSANSCGNQTQPA